jgi:hypothetical protein
MVKIAESIDVKAGEVTVFAFELLGLDGEIKVIWADRSIDSGTLLGLQYVNIEQTAIKGIPRFAR